MNWILGFVGAFAGAMLADDREVLGAVTGFFLAWLLLSMQRLRNEVEQLKRSQAAQCSLASADSSDVPRAQPASGVAAPSSLPSQPTASPEPTASTLHVAPSIGARGPMAEPPQHATLQLPDPYALERNATPPGAPPDSTAARPPVTPGWESVLVGRVKFWFTEGNVPVKIGVLVLLFGVAAALRLAAAEGYFTLSVEMRLVLIAAAAVTALGWGWRERKLRPAFGLSLQGGALGVLLLTVFAAYRLYGLLPAPLAFALVVLLVAGASLLATLQKNMWLAVLGFLGGYLAPVLISTGSGNHVALFSYYAVLNAAVFAIAWGQNWRLLNLIGFAFTFGVGTLWGSRYYRPELFASVEPFLILFFAFYISIGLLYVVRQSDHRRPWVDGTLVFGTPMLAFSLQAAMLRHDRIGMALSALFVALVYAVLVWWLRQRRGERLLTEAYAALALGFATLAVPLAFSASTTASVWALEGAGIAWLGLRQGRNFPWLAGLGLQLLAAASYTFSALDSPHGATVEARLLLLNAEWMGAAILAFSGFALSLIHERHHPRFALPLFAFVWGVFWWLVGGLGQLDRAELSIGEWRFAMLYLAATVAAAALLRDRLQWRRLNWLVALCAVFALLLVFVADNAYGAPLAVPTLAIWTVWLAALVWALSSGRDATERSLSIAHIAGLWTVALATTLQVVHLVGVQQLAQGWAFVAWTAPMALLSLGLWRRTATFAWPRAAHFADYRLGWFAPALSLMVLAVVTGLFLEGSSIPLRYLPVLNPLELSLLGLSVLLFGLFGQYATLRTVREGWPLLALAWVTMSTLRAVYHLHGGFWGWSLLNSGIAQASLTIVWSLLGVGAWIVGSRRRNRHVWMGGASLMAIVLLKLALVDRSYMGNMPGIISFMAVGLLLVGVGYIAPSPPRTMEEDIA